MFGGDGPYPTASQLRLLLVVVSFCVQVVEGVGLVASGFQFFTRLATVSAEEVGDFGSFALDGPV